MSAGGPFHKTPLKNWELSPFLCFGVRILHYFVDQFCTAFDLRTLAAFLRAWKLFNFGTGEQIDRLNLWNLLIDGFSIRGDVVCGLQYWVYEFEIHNGVD